MRWIEYVLRTTKLHTCTDDGWILILPHMYNCWQMPWRRISRERLHASCLDTRRDACWVVYPRCNDHVGERGWMSGRFWTTCCGCVYSFSCIYSCVVRNYIEALGGIVTIRLTTQAPFAFIPLCDRQFVASVSKATPPASEQTEWNFLLAIWSWHMLYQKMEISSGFPERSIAFQRSGILCAYVRYRSQ